MQNNSKYPLVVIVLLILIGLVYFLNKSTSDAPKEVINNPEGYTEGTTLSLYEKAPPTFPKGIILENRPLEYSTSITLPDGRVQSKAAYNSDKNLADLTNMYKTSLAEDGSWKLVVEANGERVATILGTRDTEKFIITMVREEAGTSVTFQHEK